MKRLMFTFGIGLFLGAMAASVRAQDQNNQTNQNNQSSQPGEPVLKTSDSITRKATVQDIDYQNRTVTLKGEAGRTFTVKVGDQVKNFNQIKPGDVVTARYYESTAVAVRRSNEPPTATERQSVFAAAPGERPEGMRVQTRQITATVDKIDRDNREVTLRMPDGSTKTIKVGQGVQGFDRLQEGDQIVATYTEQLAIAVDKPQE